MNPELRHVKLSLREKSTFYRELERLIRAGKAFPNALELLLENTRGNLRRFLRGLHAASLRGASAGEALAQQGLMVSELELSILSASERAGRLDRACAQLTAYFGALERARAAVWKRSLYPAFMLHFGVFVLAAPKLAMGGTASAYARETLGFLLLIYVAFFILLVFVKQLSRAGGTVAGIDRALCRLPLVGKIRRSFALARFCATYEAQLAAAVNTFDALASAAQSSRSAVIADAMRRAIPELHAGAQVGPVLQKSRAFPTAMTRAFRLAEETGELDVELERLTAEFEAEALSRVEMLSEWIPKLVYLIVAAYLGWQIVHGYAERMTETMKQFDL